MLLKDHTNIYIYMFGIVWLSHEYEYSVRVFLETIYPSQENNGIPQQKRTCHQNVAFNQEPGFNQCKGYQHGKTRSKI